MKEENVKTRFDNAKLIQEIPGILKCALQCNNYISTGEDIVAMRKIIGSIGMIQLYKNPEGFFVVFVNTDLTYFLTYPGSFQIEKDYFILRCEQGLFIFEINMLFAEEAMCAMLDLSYLIRRLKVRKQNFEKFLDFLASIIPNEDDNDEYDDDEEYDDED